MIRGLPYVLRPHRDRKGYPKVSVAGRTARVHKLVALAWLPAPRKGKTQVRHLDGNQENCAAWNLKWGDDKDQHRDKVHAGTSRAKRVTSTNVSERKSRVEQGTGLNESEKRGKEGNKTIGYGATRTRTTRT
jgi:hypothetical protein